MPGPTDEQRAILQENNIPVFRYNVPNPNILDLNFKFAPVYFAALTMGFRKDIGRRATIAGVVESSPYFGTFTIRSMAELAVYLYIRLYNWGESKVTSPAERNKVIAEVVGSLDPRFVEAFGTAGGHEDADALAYSVLSELDAFMEVVDKPTVIVNQFLPGDPLSILSNFSDEMYRLAMRMDIKTIPSYHLSNYGTITRESIVLAQTAPIKHSTREERTLLNRFFSGIYQIIGFKHHISSTDSYSEFALSKSQTSPTVRAEMEARREAAEGAATGI